MPNPLNEVHREIQFNEFERFFKARMDAVQLTGEKLVEQHRLKCAEALLTAGLRLIPSDHLQDHEFVVSRGVYEAAKNIGAK